MRRSAAEYALSLLKRGISSSSSSVPSLAAASASTASKWSPLGLAFASTALTKPTTTTIPFLSRLISPYTTTTAAAAAAWRRSYQSMSFPPRGPSQYKLWQARFDPGGSAVIWSLIGANGLVYLYWKLDPYSASKHFVVSLESMRSGRVWTALTSAFSQQDTMHLASNCISLFFFGSDLGRIFGGRPLLALYLTGGIVGSLAHCAHSYYKEQQRRSSTSSRWSSSAFSVSRGALGASAAVNAIVVVDVLLFPTRTILLYGLIPMPAALLGLLWLWNDLGGALDGGGGSGVAHAGHLGGAATGLAFYLAFRRGKIRPRGWW